VNFKLRMRKNQKSSTSSPVTCYFSHLTMVSLIPLIACTTIELADESYSRPIQLMLSELSVSSEASSSLSYLTRHSTYSSCRHYGIRKDSIYSLTRRWREVSYIQDLGLIKVETSSPALGYSTSGAPMPLERVHPTVSKVLSVGVYIAFQPFSF
jgi:hypothetical protein